MRTLNEYKISNKPAHVVGVKTVYFGIKMRGMDNLKN